MLNKVKLKKDSLEYANKFSFILNDKEVLRTAYDFREGYKLAHKELEKVPVNFLKWFLDGNSESYYAKTKTLEELYEQYLNQL